MQDGSSHTVDYVRSLPLGDVPPGAEWGSVKEDGSGCRSAQPDSPEPSTSLPNRSNGASQAGNDEDKVKDPTKRGRRIARTPTFVPESAKSTEPRGHNNYPTASQHKPNSTDRLTPSLLEHCRDNYIMMRRNITNQHECSQALKVSRNSTPGACEKDSYQSLHQTGSSKPDNQKTTDVRTPYDTNTTFTRQRGYSDTMRSQLKPTQRDTNPHGQHQTSGYEPHIPETMDVRRRESQNTTDSQPRTSITQEKDQSQD